MDLDGTRFDRLVKGLATSTVRREALKASLAGIMARAVASFNHEADAKKKKNEKKKKKKCKNRNVSCAASAECCGAEFGVIACRQHQASQGDCTALFPGLRCCGLEGVTCDASKGNCDCCDDLVCDLADDNQLRCLPAEI